MTTTTMTPLAFALQSVQSEPAAMHDIVAAPAVSWWPLAPGWWFVIAAILGLCLVTIVLIVRYWRRRRIQRLALRQLAQVPADQPHAITLTLKQAALAYFSRDQIAQLSGANWYAFLLQQLPVRQQKRWQGHVTEWQQQAFQPESGMTNNYHEFAGVWLSHALPPKTRGRRHD